MLTVEQVAHALPANLKKAATPSFVNQLNAIAADPEVAEAIRENFLSYTKVLSEGKFKVEDYLNAVAYVSFKLMGYSNEESYERAFPQRYANLLAKGTSSKDISAYVSMYNKGKLVNLILEQSLVPTWVLNADAYQKAINTQVDLMTNAKSEMVRATAANSILTHLKKPEATGPLLNVNVNQNSGLNELMATITQLAEKQQQLIQAGVPTKAIASQPLAIVDAEVVE